VNSHRQCELEVLHHGERTRDSALANWSRGGVRGLPYFFTAPKTSCKSSVVRAAGMEQRGNAATAPGEERDGPSRTEHGTSHGRRMFHRTASCTLKWEGGQLGRVCKGITQTEDDGYGVVHGGVREKRPCEVVLG
jgi:hypothetical protein